MKTNGHCQSLYIDGLTIKTKNGTDIPEVMLETTIMEMCQTINKNDFQPPIFVPS
jgi:hypothetical protein